MRVRKTRVSANPRQFAGATKRRVFAVFCLSGWLSRLITVLRAPGPGLGNHVACCYCEVSGRGRQSTKARECNSEEFEGEVYAGLFHTECQDDEVGKMEAYPAPGLPRVP